MEKYSEETFRKLKEDVSTYVELKFKLLKLNTYERTAKVISTLSYGVVLLLLAFFAILFIFLALGFFLGEILHSTGAGFACMAALYLIMILILVRKKQYITDKVTNIVISSLSGDDENEEQTTDSSEDGKAEHNTSGKADS